MSGQTSSCSATVYGTGNFNPAVTFAASAGTIAATGTTAVFTAPVVASSTAVTVTATSVQDPTKSATVTITVGPLVPVISGIVPDWFYLDGPALMGNIQANGSGFAAGETFQVSPLFGTLTLGQGTVSNQFLFNVSVASNTYSPGWFDLSLTTAQGNTSNVKRWAFVGNQNTLAIGASGELFHLDQAQGLSVTSSNGFVRKFKADGTADGSFWVGALLLGIAADDKTGDVTIGFGASDANGNIIGTPANDNNPATGMGIAAKSGQVCITRPSGNIVSCFAIGQNSAQIYSATVGIQPWSVTMVKPASELDAIVYSRGDTALWKVSVPDMTVRGSVTLSGITPVTSNPGTVGGWQVASGSLGNTAVVLAQADEQLAFVDIGTMSVTTQVSLKTLLGTGNVHPFRVALDEPHGKALVAVADTDAGLTRFVSVDAASGAMATIAATSTLLSVGFGVSADGATLYSCERAACEAWPTAAVQPQATAPVAARAGAAAPSSVLYLGGGTGAAADTPGLVPEIAFSASRTEVKPGRAVFLSWSAKDVASCFAFGDWQDPRPTSGAETVLPKQEGTFTYSLACTGEDGDTVKSVTVAVRENPAVLPPTLDVSAPAKVRVGESAAIRWATTNADSCSAGDLGDQPTNGSAFVASPIPGSFTRTLTCVGPGGAVSRSVTLTVGLPNPLDLF
ncbi:MAG: hypothetical protein ABSF25_19685 [Bryobacteraceae bacterium]|jgi:hypothetical protein